MAGGRRKEWAAQVEHCARRDEVVAERGVLLDERDELGPLRALRVRATRRRGVGARAWAGERAGGREDALSSARGEGACTSSATMTGRETRRARTLVTPNWLPVPPRRSLRPARSITFLFSDPLNAANMLFTEPAISAVVSNSIE